VRALQVQVRTGELERVLAAARDHGAHRPLAVRAERTGAGDADDERSLVFLQLPNERVGEFVDAARRAVEDDIAVVLLPIGALPLETPLTELDSRVREVSRLSTLELVIASLQSVGAWRGMLMFSALAGVIAAYGLIFDVSYVLVAAMLVNPMGAPALVSVVGTAIGDARMFGRGALRFVVSLLIQATAALCLGYAYDLSISTPMMEQVTALSKWAVVIAFAAGAAGAQALVKSERDSLVSGTAAGFMVAAALAPPAAVLGLAIPLGRWDYFALMAFLLALQYVAIVVGGWTGLAVSGVRPGEPSIGRGRAGTRSVLLAGVAVLSIGLVAWQTRLEPRFMKADLSRVALEIARDATDERADALLVNSTAAFTRRDIRAYAGDALLIEVVVESRAPGVNEDSIAAGLRRRIRALVHERMDGVIPFIAVTVLPSR
jgi:uncharacterized hydrophobic protein (TIGR00271 family)